MKKERIEYFTELLLFVVLLTICVLVAFKKVIPVLLPFIIAFAVAAGMRRPARRLSAKLHVPERVLRLLLSLFVTLVIFSLAGVLIWRTATYLFKILTDISEDEAFLSGVLSIFDRDLPIFDRLPDGLYDKIVEAFGSVISTTLSAVASFLSSVVTTVPKILLFITVTVIALIYFALDLDRISEWLCAVLPEKIKSRITDIRENVLILVWKYLKSYFLIMLITFAVVLSGLFILRVENAFITAIIIAFLDILPVIGVGTVLIPWSIFSFFSGKAATGVGLIVLFLVNTVIRQLSEPKILGKNLDLHPILTLIFIYVGYALFGALGIILLPIVGVGACVYLKKNASSKVAKNTATADKRNE